MSSPYKKECWLTLVAFVLAAFLTHIYPIYFLFPAITRFEVLGYPAHYFLTMFLGWLVLMPLYYLYMVLSEKIDREIEQTSAANAQQEQVVKLRVGAR